MKIKTTGKNSRDIFSLTFCPRCYGKCSSYPETEISSTRTCTEYCRARIFITNQNPFQNIPYTEKIFDTLWAFFLNTCIGFFQTQTLIPCQDSCRCYPQIIRLCLWQFFPFSSIIETACESVYGSWCECLILYM